MFTSLDILLKYQIELSALELLWIVFTFQTNIFFRGVSDFVAGYSHVTWGRGITNASCMMADVWQIYGYQLVAMVIIQWLILIAASYKYALIPWDNFRLPGMIQNYIMQRQMRILSTSLMVLPTPLDLPMNGHSMQISITALVMNLADQWKVVMVKMDRRQLGIHVAPYHLKWLQTSSICVHEILACKSCGRFLVWNKSSSTMQSTITLHVISFHPLEENNQQP